jgi:hypothetical protein
MLSIPTPQLLLTLLTQHTLNYMSSDSNNELAFEYTAGVCLNSPSSDHPIPNIDVMNLHGPPSVQATSKKIDTLKRRTQEITRDQKSRDDTQISYLEMLEEQDHDNLMLAQMLAR